MRYNLYMVAGIKSLFQKPKWRTWLFVFFVLGFYITRTRPPDTIKDIALNGRYGYMAAGKDGVIVLDFYSGEEDSLKLLTNPVYISEFDTLGIAHHLEVDDDWVYVANDTQGLLILSKERLLAGQSSSEEDITEHIILTPGKALDIAVGDKHIYILDSKEGIIVIQKKKIGDDDPGSISFSVSGKPQRIKLFGSQIFVTNDESQLLRFKLNKPDDLELDYTFDIGSQINNFTLRENNLYLATETEGFLIIKNSSQPGELIGTYKEIQTFYDVSLKGDYAFVAAGKEGFLTFSIKKSETTVKIGQEKKPNNANLIFWIDDFIYVADGCDGLKTFESKVSFDYKEKNKAIQQGQYNEVLVKDDIAYIAAGDFGLQVINVKDSLAPKNKYYPDIKIDENNKDNATALDINGYKIYVAYQKAGLRVFDISENKENPIKTEKSYPTAGEANDVVIEDDIAYVAIGDAGLQVFDLKTEDREGNIENTTGHALGVFVLDDYAYVAAANKGLQIIQVSDPQKPTRIEGIDTPGTATAVHVVEVDDENNGKKIYAFVADGEGGLFIADVTDPNYPAKLTSLKTGEYANDVLVRGKTVYILDKSDGLVTIKIDPISDPSRMGNRPTPGNALGLFLLDNMNYIADDLRGLHIISTENKNEPVEIGFYDIPKDIKRLLADSDFAYLVDGSSGFWVLSLQNRDAPHPVAFYPTPGQATDIAIFGKFAYIADGDRGIRILNIENPKKPKFAGIYNQVGRAISIAVDEVDTTAEDENELLVFVGSDQNEMYILNAEDKGNVEEEGVYKTAGRPSRIAVHDGYTYISEGEKGLEIVLVKEPDDLVSYLANHNDNFDLIDTRSVEILPSDNLVKIESHNSQDAQPAIIVADGKHGMKILNVFRPFNPDLIFEFPMEEGGEAQSASAVDGYAFLSAGKQGLFTFYVWDLNRISLVGEESPGPQTEVIAALSSIHKKEDGNSDNRFHNYVFTSEDALYTYQVNGQPHTEFVGEYELIGEATVGQIFSQLLNALRHRDPSLIQEKVITRIQYIAFGIFVLVFVSLFWLVLFSRFILPIQTLKGWGKAYRRLWASLWGSHGPAILVKGGNLVSDSKDLEPVGRGVARLDFNSAIVLERHSMINDRLRRYYDKFKEGVERKGIKLPRSHAESSGVVFIRPFEKVRGYADFRTQFRIRPGVKAYTRDGIEVNNPVWVLFTLGQSPEVLDVTYVGARKPENIQVISFEEDATITLANGDKQRGLLVKYLVDELDESDKEEIHLFVQNRIVGKFFQRVKTLLSEIDSTRNPEEVIEEFIEIIELLISRYEIEERKRIQKFMEEISQTVEKCKRDGTIDPPALEWFAYRIGVLVDDNVNTGMTTFHQLVYSLKRDQYIQELEEIHLEIAGRLQNEFRSYAEEVQQMHQRNVQILQKLHQDYIQELRKMHKQYSLRVHNSHQQNVNELQDLYERYNKDLQEIHRQDSEEFSKRRAIYIQDIQLLHQKNALATQTIFDEYSKKIQKLHQRNTEKLQKLHEKYINNLQILHQQYDLRLKPLQIPKESVEYAQERIEQYFKKQNKNDDDREFIQIIFRTKLIIDRKINRYIDDNKIDEVKNEQLIVFNKKIATNTAELIRTDYPFTGLYGLVANLYSCVKIANQIASQVTISDEWRFPNMDDLFKIRNTLREIQEGVEEQETACKLEIERYLDLVIINDFVTVSRRQLKYLRLAITQDEKTKATKTCVDSLQKEIKNLDQITDPAYQNQISKLKESVLRLDKKKPSEVYFFLKQVDELWQKIKAADVLITQSFLRKSQEQFVQVQKNLRLLSKLVRTGETYGEVEQYQEDIVNIQKQLDSCSIQEKLRIATPPKQLRVGAYLFDRKRVIAAVYSEAKDQDREEFEKEQMHWTNLPVHVAAQTFRDLVSKEQYDYLYQPNDPYKFNLPKLKANMRRAVRNLGVLAFRYVDHIDGLPLKAGGELVTENLIYYKNRELKNPKVLRSRGIKVIASGFPDLFPVSVEMPTRQLSHWSAPWEKDATILRSQGELEALRVINRARSQAQREMAYALARIIQSSGSEEALAIRVFQALEAVAADQENRHFLPRDTLHLLHRFQRWFIDPDNEENGDRPDNFDLPDRDNPLLE